MPCATPASATAKDPGIRRAASASAPMVPMNRLRLAPNSTGTPRL